MRFFIIENNRGALALLIHLLRTCFEGAAISPRPGATTDKWSIAETLLSEEALDEEEQIIFCDLALDCDDPSDAQAGITKARQLWASKPKATWIAYTSFVDILKYDAVNGLFHGILNKQDLAKCELDSERATLVERIVRTALNRRRGGTRVAYVAEDSLGMRTFHASFPGPVLDELIATECSDWREIYVHALSAGYSGSSLLALRGHKSGAPRHIVVKLAPRRELILRESLVLRQDGEFFGECVDFAQRCACAQDVKVLPDHLGYYSLQGAISGPTLAALFQDELGSMDDGERRNAALHTLINIELAQYEHGWLDPEGEIIRRERRLCLSSIDCYRAKKTCRDLPLMAEVIAEMGGWSDNWPSPMVLFREIERVIDEWESLRETVGPLHWVLQHGDLNPNNVFVDDNCQVTFIDLARLDHWPVGYDLCRLVIQLRIRFIDQSRGRDWLQNNLSRWREEPLFALDGTADPSCSLCPPAALCEQQLYSWMAQQRDAEILINGARFCAVLDLIRIISYADLSPYKRLLAALELWDQTLKLGWHDKSEETITISE
jgi:hypothetical protein